MIKRAFVILYYLNCIRNPIFPSLQFEYHFTGGRVFCFLCAAVCSVFVPVSVLAIAVIFTVLNPISLWGTYTTELTSLYVFTDTTASAKDDVSHAVTITTQGALVCLLSLRVDTNGTVIQLQPVRFLLV